MRTLEVGLIMQQKIKKMRRINLEVVLIRQKMTQQKINKMKNKMKIKRKTKEKNPMMSWIKLISHLKKNKIKTIKKK
jgi:hypothetical protein